MGLSDLVKNSYERIKTDSLFVRYNASLFIGEAFSVYTRGKSSGWISNYLNEQNLSNLTENFLIALAAGVVAGLAYQGVRWSASVFLEKDRRNQSDLTKIGELGNFFGKSFITSFKLNIATTVANIGLLSYLSPQTSGYIAQTGLAVAYIYMMNVNRDKTIMESMNNNLEMIANGAKKVTEYISHPESHIIE